MTIHRIVAQVWRLVPLGPLLTLATPQVLEVGHTTDRCISRLLLYRDTASRHLWYDDYLSLSKLKTDQQKRQVSVCQLRVLDSQVLAYLNATQVKCRKQWIYWYWGAFWYWESIIRDRQSLEMCPEPCWQVWEADKRASLRKVQGVIRGL